MTEELKQKAEAEADKVIIGSGMDRASVIHLKHLLVTMYMQGAIENSIQWHDLRKDPNDLPKENELYLVFGYTNKREKFYELDVFDPKEEEFLGCGEYVYAWCEIPLFKE